MADVYEQLAADIIVKAARDYRLCRRCLRKNPEFAPAQRMKTEVERFFLSDWFSALTTLDGAKLLSRLDAEVVV